MTKITSIFIQSGSPDYTLSFKSPEVCPGEVLLAELYGTSPVESIEEIVPLYSVHSGTDLGGNKGDIIEVQMDFALVPSGNYYLKVYTAETGVLAKTVVRVE